VYAAVQSDEGAASAPGVKSTTSAAAAAPAPSVGGGGDMMSEMANRLRARKAKAEADMNAQTNVCAPELVVHEPCCNELNNNAIRCHQKCTNRD